MSASGIAMEQGGWEGKDPLDLLPTPEKFPSIAADHSISNS